MPVNDDISNEIIEEILKNKTIDEVEKSLGSVSPEEKQLPPALPREFSFTKKDQEMRLEILKKSGINFEYLNNKKHIEDPGIFKGNIENYIGTAQVPVGVIGPLRINGVYAKGDFYIPMATTEGALIASYNRGTKIISHCGGVRVLCLTERVSRAPGFHFNNLIEAGKFIIWISKNLDKLKDIVKSATKFGVLKNIKTTVEGNYVFLNFEYTTGDASGQNMVTIATDKICKYIIDICPIKPLNYFIESNMSGDKKATSMSYIFVRGKKVTAEITIPEKICKRFLHTEPEKIMEYAKMSIFGAVQTGAYGIQGHYANALTAIFIACGQDVACVSESHVGITRIDLNKNNELYFSATLPNLIVGTVGGGTNLPTQKECLEMIGCLGENKARKFAEICAAAVLAGEISIVGALAAGSFTHAHIKYARDKK
jgi:hydroxymethylglutaryl-CoA reductase (NADPH)